MPRLIRPATSSLRSFQSDEKEAFVHVRLLAACTVIASLNPGFSRRCAFWFASEWYDAGHGHVL
jgi:hypothetical protein